MKLISTVFILLLSGLAFSQFNRTFLHGTQSLSSQSFGSYAYCDDQNKVLLTSIENITNSEVSFITERISEQGDLETFDRVSYPINLLGIGSVQCLLLTVLEQANERYYVLATGDANVRLIWLKTNKTDGTLINAITSTNTYKRGYFEPKLVGSELVSYGVKSVGSSAVGLVRVALNTGSFTTPTEELVSATDTNSVSLQNLKNGYKSGNLFVINGVEKMVKGVGSSPVVIYTRTTANTYTAVTTGIPNYGSVSSFLINPTTIGITNGTSIEHYSAAGTLVNSGTFPWEPTNTSHILYSDNRYHMMYKYSVTHNLGLFYTADQNFNRIDSVPTYQKRIYHLQKTANGLLLLGSDVSGGLSMHLDGSPVLISTAVYCETYKSFPVMDKDEYGTLLRSGQQLKVTVGLGTKVITDPYSRVGGRYDSIPVVTDLSEHFVGFIGSVDTISNERSVFSNQFDELPGPYTTSAMYDEILEAKYNRPYRVSRQMIQNHIDSIAFGSDLYIPQWAIRNWPAHGNAALGQAENLAPFADINSNGIYEPMLGEYPSILGNDCVFSITHYRDNGNPNKALEFHSYVYTQACDTSEAFNQVLMRKIRVYSRGAEIDSLFFGGRFNGRLGHTDDYAGTNIDLGMIYQYNGDLYDDDFPISDAPGFKERLATHGIMVLKGFKEANDGLDNGVGILPGQSVNGYGFNDGIIDNEHGGLYAGNIFTETSEPSGDSDMETAEKWYHVLNGSYLSGDTIYYGGTDLSPGTTIPTRYIYSGSEDTYHFGTAGIDPGFDWYENEPAGTGSTANQTGRRRWVYSFGKTALADGEMVELDYAYLIQRQPAPVASIVEPVTDLFVKAAAVRSAFLSNDGPCGINFDPIEENLSVEESKMEENPFTVYPNPTTGTIRINGISENGATIRVFDLNGKLLQTVSDYQAMQVLDLSNLQGNLFILQITDGSKSSQKRVVKY